jgi:Methyltransferase domain
MTLRSLANRAYVRAAAPFGRRALARMLRDGLPERLDVPLRFLLDGQAPPRAQEVADATERVRAEIATRRDPFTLPPTSTSHPPVPTWSWLANGVSVQRRWGLFLHLCAAGADNVLELGSCVGISGAYLATAARRLVTIEASPELASVAAETLARFSPNTVVLRGMFDERLADALDAPVGFAFIDGHHDRDATLRYVRAIAPHLERGAIVVLDDIRLYREMWALWAVLRAMPGVGASVDTGRFGILVWGEGEPRLYDLSPYTGWWWRPMRRRPPA